MSSKKSLRPADRLGALSSKQALKMARSAHAYVRGSTVQFYEWLEMQKRGTLPEGPPVWICGDCHVGNLGPVAAIDGRIAIQIRDLDQTVIGNPAHDLIRLALSLATASRGSTCTPTGPGGAPRMDQGAGAASVQDAGRAKLAMVERRGTDRQA